MIALPKDDKNSESLSTDLALVPPPSYTSVVPGPSTLPHGQGPLAQFHRDGPLAGQPMHYYYNPVDNRMIATTLGPQTPEMVCLVEGHQVEKRFGVFGVLAAVMFFPWGIAFCALDRKSICTRCQKILDNGCLP